MVSAVFDHIVAILVVGAVFVSAVVVLPMVSFGNLQAVDQQQLRNTALNVFNTILLDTGRPTNWGALPNFTMNDPRVQRFGLANAEDSRFFVLDPDKVQKLVIGNPLNFCEYNSVRSLLGLQGYGFMLKIIPPFNVTFLNVPYVVGNVLHYSVKVTYLTGDPIPNALSDATAVYTKKVGDEEFFNVTESTPVLSNVMGIAHGSVTLAYSEPEYFMVTVRVTVADVATLVVMSGNAYENSIANINLVYDTMILTRVEEDQPKDNVWIYNIIAFDSEGSLWSLYDGNKDQESKLNSGQGEFEFWRKTFYGLHGFNPVLLIFNFWAVDPLTGNGRSQILVVMAYPNLLTTNIFQYGGSPSIGKTSVAVQRSVMISGMTYTAELWLWKE